MARGKWLSEEEKAEITRLHAGGMKAAQIATQMQRGAKTIQRVLNGTHGTDSESKLLSATVSSAPSVGRVDRDEAPRRLAVEAEVATVEVAPAVTASRQRTVPSVQISARAPDRKAQTVKPPTRPKKLPQQAPVSLPSVLAVPVTPLPLLQVPSASTFGRVDRERIFGRHHDSASASVVLEPSSTVQDSRTGEEAPSGAHSVAPTSYTQPRRLSVNRGTIPRVTTIHDAQPGPFVIPDERLSGQVEDTLDEEIESMANIISDDDNDNDVSTPLQGQSSHSRSHADQAATSWSSEHRPEHNVRQNEMGSIAQLNNAVPSPLSSFDNHLRSSQASSWSSSTSQVEPEPVVIKKRKVQGVVTSKENQDPIERALAAFHDIINGDATESQPNIHGQRLMLLFNRFQADVRLVQLERKLGESTSSATTFSF